MAADVISRVKSGWNVGSWHPEEYRQRDRREQVSGMQEQSLESFPARQGSQELLGRPRSRSQARRVP